MSTTSKLTPEEILRQEELLLKEWQKVHQHFLQYKIEIDKLSLQFNNEKTKLVYLLDLAYRDSHFDEKEETILGRLIEDLIFELICDDEINSNDKLKELHDSYSKVSFDEKKAKYDFTLFKAIKIIFKDKKYREAHIPDICSHSSYQSFNNQRWGLFFALVRRYYSISRTDELADFNTDRNRLLNLSKHPIHPKFDTDEVNKIRRKLLKIYHPDKVYNASDEVKSKYNEISSKINYAWERRDYFSILLMNEEGDAIVTQNLGDFESEVDVTIKMQIILIDNEIDSILHELSKHFEEDIDYDSANQWINAMPKHIKDVKHAIKKLRTMRKGIKNTDKLQEWLHERTAKHGLVSTILAMKIHFKTRPQSASLI